ncbi:hypothetical protein Tco_1388450 [Tanacetum coccineum]
MNLTPSIPFVLEYPSSSPILVVDSDFLIEEVDTFLILEESIPLGIESDFDLEGDIIFLNDLLNDDPIPEYEHFIFDIEPDAPMINNFDELNEDKCFDLGGGEIVFSPNVEDDDSFTFFIRTFLPFLTYPKDSLLLFSTGSEDTIFDPGGSPLSRVLWFVMFVQDCPDFEGSRARCFVHRSLALQSLACLYWESDIQILSTNNYL